MYLIFIEGGISIVYCKLKTLNTCTSRFTSRIYISLVYLCIRQMESSITDQNSFTVHSSVIKCAKSWWPIGKWCSRSMENKWGASYRKRSVFPIYILLISDLSPKESDSHGSRSGTATAALVSYYQQPGASGYMLDQALDVLFTLSERSKKAYFTSCEWQQCLSELSELLYFLLI